MLVGEVGTKLGHINLVPINIGNIHIHKSTQTETRYP